MSKLTDLFKQTLTGLDFFGNNILIPALFAIALVFFVHGLFNYLALGPGDEEKREQGRGQLFKTNIYLIITALIWTVFWTIGWLSSDFSFSSLGPDPGLEKEEKVLPVPNTPLR